MKSINGFLEESEIEFTLRGAYKECWDRMLTAIQHLDSTELDLLSNPFLIKALPSYRKAKKKVLFVGQETSGWDSFKITTDSFQDRYDEESRREIIIDYLQWMYEDLRFQRKWDHTPFWKGVRRLYQAISPGSGDDGFLHTQLVRFDLANRRPPQPVEELLQREYNVLPMEIYALAPDVVVFLTGPEYDNRIRKTFQNVGASNVQLRMEQVRDFSPDVLSRIVHSSLPYHTYRTYHPNYSLHYNENTIFTPVELTLSDIVKANSQ